MRWVLGMVESETESPVGIVLIQTIKGLCVSFLSLFYFFLNKKILYDFRKLKVNKLNIRWVVPNFWVVMRIRMNAEVASEGGIMLFRVQ